MSTPEAAPNANDAIAPREPGPARAFVRGARAAVVVLTRVPLGGFPYSDSEWRWSAAHMPLVGAAIGALASLAYLASLRAGALVAAVVAVAASMLVTGALHEDGLADSADALGGGRTPERVFAILKDSRIGTFGAAALVIAITLRIALVARLSADAPIALVVAGAASRLSPVILIATLPYVTDPAVAKSRSVAGAGAPQLAVAAAVTLAIAGGACALGLIGAVALSAAIVSMLTITAFAGAYFRARVGGVTGDFLGAAQQVGECAILLAIAIARGGAA